MSLQEHFARVDRAKIWAACYRVTGCAADADEVLQEAFARALEAAPIVSDAMPLEPWLLKVAVRLAIDRLRRRREEPYDGPWLPSPVEIAEMAPPALAASSSDEPSTRYELVESASVAFLLALEALGPTQRAVIVLRDVLDLSVAETAGVLDESEDNVRAVHHRARARLAAYDRDRVRPDAALRDRAQMVLQTLFAHLVSGDTAAAMALLSDSVRLMNDAGGYFTAARKAVVGPDHVVRFFVGVLRKVGLPDRIELRVLTGLPAFEARYDHIVPGYSPRLVTGVVLDRDGRVATLFSVLSPRKLTHLPP